MYARAKLTKNTGHGWSIAEFRFRIALRESSWLHRFWYRGFTAIKAAVFRRSARYQKQGFYSHEEKQRFISAFESQQAENKFWHIR